MKKILKDLQAGAADPNGAKVYWLNGMGGTGKTTILYSFTKILEKGKQLGANYFCSHMSPLCRDPKNIVPNLAFQLSQYSQPFRSQLCQIIEQKPQASKLEIKTQFKFLLHDSLQQIKDSMPLGVVIVVDALDECTNGYIFIETLLGMTFDLPVKFLLSSCPEPSIEKRMQRPYFSPSVLHLHNIEESIVSADIKLYLLHL